MPAMRPLAPPPRGHRKGRHEGPHRTLLGTVFGLIFVFLSLLVAVETVMPQALQLLVAGRGRTRRLRTGGRRDDRLQPGADGARAHPGRCLSRAFPRGLQAALNWLSIVALARFPGCIAWLAWFTVQDTRVPERVADALGDAAGLAAERVADRAGRVRGGLRLVRDARDAAAVHRRDATAEPAISSRAAPRRRSKEELDDLRTADAMKHARRAQ